MKINKSIINWLLLIFVAFIWGSPYILREKALVSFSHSQLAGLQVFLSFILFIPFIVKSIKKLNKKNIPILILSGLTGNVGPSFFFALAQTKINSSAAGMLNALLPIVTLVISIIAYKLKPNKYTLLSIIIGLIGSICLVLSQESQGVSYFWGVFYVFMAILSVGISINIVSFSLPKLTGIEIAALSFFFVGPLAGIFLCFTDLQNIIINNDFTSSAIVLLLLAISTFVGVIMYNLLIKRSSHIFAASIAYIIPLVAIFWGITIGGDQINIKQIISITIILVGLSFLNKETKKDEPNKS